MEWFTTDEILRGIECNSVKDPASGNLKNVQKAMHIDEATELSDGIGLQNCKEYGLYVKIQATFSWKPVTKQLSTEETIK